MRKISKILLTLVVLVAAFFCFSCEEGRTKPTLLGIELDYSNVTTELYVGDSFDYSALAIKANYDEGTTTLKLKDVKVDASLVDTTKKGEYVVTVTYEEAEAYFKVTVSEKPVTFTNISVDTSKFSKEIYEKQEFNFDNLKVYANYSNSTKEEVTGFTVDDSLVNTEEAGTYTVKVSYEGKDYVFRVTVKDLWLESIEASGAETNFIPGFDFTSDDLVVKAKYNSKETKEITDYTIDSSNYDATKIGEYTINISYTEEGITATTSYKVNVVDKIDSVKVDAANGKTEYAKGETFDKSDIIVKLALKDETEVEVEKYTYKVFDADGKEVTTFTKTGDYKVVYSYLTYTAELPIKVTNNGYFEVSTVADYEAMRTYTSANKVNDAKWLLMNDIDFAGITLSDVSATADIFTGEFNGNGHKLSNITYSTKTAKISPMFGAIQGGTVKNLTIFGAVVSQTAESIGIICGTCTAANFENIEFSSCAVSNSSSSGYAALLCGRNTAKATVNVKQITVKNMTSVTGVKYVGGLIGDVTSGSTVNFEDIDLNVTLTGGSQLGGLAGRVRGGTVNVKNAVLRIAVADNGGTTTKFGALIDGAAACKLNATNVVILSLTKDGSNMTNSDIWLGNNKSVTGTFTNCYAVAAEATINNAATGIKQIKAADANWKFFVGNGFDSKLWEEDSRFGAKLIASSSNTPGKDATITKLMLVDGNAPKQFFKGDSFSADGLIVIAQYSDGVVITLEEKEYKISVTDTAGTTIEGEFSAQDVGAYKAKVTAGAVSVSYDINIVKEIFMYIENYEYDSFVTGSKLDLTGLVVFIGISDGTKVLATSNQYVVQLLKSNEEVVDVTDETILTKEFIGVRVSRLDASGKPMTDGNFYEAYEIHVYDAPEQQDVVVAYVDGENSGYVGEKLYFYGIKQALNYFKQLELPEETIKEIRVYGGEYRETFTVEEPNVRIVKADDDKSQKDVVISYNNASDTKTPDRTTTYGTDGSATVTIKATATGFYAYGIYFKNTFDYAASSFANKQALAVLCAADQSTFIECKFSGFQDTLEAKSGRQYYKDCYIEGCTDYIFGNNASVIFDGCEIHNVVKLKADKTPEANQGYVCATKGYATGETDSVKFNYVFTNCKFTADEAVPAGSVSIARPWGTYSSVVIINSEIGAHISTAAYDGTTKSRYTDMSGNLPTLETVFFAEYNNTGAGAINTAVAGCTILTENEAKTYNIDHVFGKNNGKLEYAEAWIPETYKDKVYVAIGAQTSYEQNAKFNLPTIAEVTKNAANVANAVISIKDAASKSVEIEDVTKTIGKYTLTATVEGLVVYTIEFEVTEAGNQTVKKTYTLNVGELVAASVLKEGDVTAPVTVASFFTLNATDSKSGDKYNQQMTIDASSKTVGEYSFTHRMKLNGRGTAAYRNIEFTTKGKAKVTIYVLSSSAGDETRTVDILSSTSTDASVVTSSCAPGKFGDAITYTLNEAGTYYITSLANGINFYGVVVEVDEPLFVNKTYELNVSSEVTATTLAVGEIEADVEVTDFFKIHATSSKKLAIDANSKTVGEKSFTQRLKLNGTGTTTYRSIEFTTKGAATVTIYVVSSSTKSADRTVDIISAASPKASVVTSVCADASNVTAITYNLSEAGTYYITSLVGAVNIYDVIVSVKEPA